MVGTPSSLAANLQLATSDKCSFSDPWERFSRATDIPDLINRLIFSTVAVAGPRVHTILVRGLAFRNGGIL